MNVKWYEPGMPEISKIRTEIDGKDIKLSFKWHNSIKEVYVYKLEQGKEDSDINWDAPYRRYSKEEYIRSRAFLDRNVKAGVYYYIICPHFDEDGEDYIIRYETQSNRKKVVTAKVDIKYQVREKMKVVRKVKLVEMIVECSTDIDKDVLCYTKNQNRIPANREDGICFDFIEDFHKGVNVLEEIEMDKEASVDIFLADNIKFPELYNIERV